VASFLLLSLWQESHKKESVTKKKILIRMAVSLFYISFVAKVAFAFKRW
jgi:hypothetical protein